MPVEPYSGERGWEDDGLDFENRMLEPGYTPEDQEVENPLRPAPFRNTSARTRSRRT